MKTDFDFDGRYLAAPAVFRPDFNSFKTINATQAWALFLTASRNETVLGESPELGQFFTNILFAIAFTGAVGSLIYFGFLG